MRWSGLRSPQVATLSPAAACPLSPFPLPLCPPTHPLSLTVSTGKTTSVTSPKWPKTSRTWASVTRAVNPDARMRSSRIGRGSAGTAAVSMGAAGAAPPPRPPGEADRDMERVGEALAILSAIFFC